MSGVFPLLTCLDEQAMRLQGLGQWLRRLSVPTVWQPLPAVPCLRFELRGPHGRMVCLVQAQDWAGHHLPRLQGLDWQAMDHAVLAGLCALDLPLRFQPDPWGFDQGRFLELSMAGPAAPAHPQVQSLEGALWIEQLEWHGPAPAPPIQVEGHERVPVQLHLGRLSHCVSRLRRLLPGDILLVPYTRCQAWRANRCLFEFTLQPESLAVTMIYPTDAESPLSSEPALGRAPILDLASLPLTLEVVLCTLQLSLSELSDLGAGSTLSLPEQAYRHVRIEHNGHCVARGELVQVGASLGVQLTQAPQLK